MSTAATPPVRLNPMQTIAHVVAESAPKIIAAAQLIALEDHRRMLASHATRVAESHRAMARAAGMEELVSPKAEESMGNLIVTGDINVSDPASLQAALGGLTGSVPAAAAAAGRVSKLVAPALVAASLLGGGALGGGASWLLNALNPPAPSVTNLTQPIVQQDLGIEVVPGGADSSGGSGK